MIVLDRVTFGYPDQAPVFEEFSWRASAGDSWVVIGPSGSGKSTLLYLLAGLRQPTAGTVLVDGQPVPRPRASTGLILQDYGLLSWATVRDNVALGQRLGHFYRRKPPDENGVRPYPPPDIPPQRVDLWLSRLDILGVQDQYPAQVSGGQRQRTAIARTFVLEPSLLLMDEPFSSLDALTREGLEEVTLGLQAETNVTTVIVTHNIEEAAFLGRQILVLGHPPHRTARVIDNPYAGVRRFREHPAFQAKCSELRHALGDHTAAPRLERAVVGSP
jgi:ABC-type nitrate/sulfonate/bicarbonate transport system ATPase subunit